MNEIIQYSNSTAHNQLCVLQFCQRIILHCQVHIYDVLCQNLKKSSPLNLRMWSKNNCFCIRFALVIFFVSQSFTMSDDAASHRFHWFDYVVFLLTLSVSLGIGVFFALSGSRQGSTGEFLMGNRQMKLIPVVISLIVSYTSAIGN